VRYGNLAEYLDRLPYERAVLFACSDDWVRAAAELPPPHAERFPISQASPTVLDYFLDKVNFARLVQKHGVPHPRTTVLESENDLATLPDELIVGSFLKPRNSQAFSARYHVKAFSISSRDEAVRRFRQAQGDGLTVMLQTYVPGPPTRHYFIDGFIDRGGNIRAHFARQRIRMYPLDYGNSSYMTSVSLADVAPAREALDALLTAVGYRGIFSAEFKYDERDSTFKILEVNVRPWWYIEFMEMCGINVSVMAYRDALGLEVQSVEDYAVGVHCVFPCCDLSTSIRMMRKGELRFGSWVSSWLQARQAIFHWNDPLPSVANVIARIREKLVETISPPRDTRR